MPGDPGVTPGATPANRPANPSGSQDGRPNGTQDQRRRQGGHRGGQRDQQPPRVPKFEGKCPELAGHIYDYSNARQAADKYTKTTREICEYVGRTYKFGADTKVALQTLKKPVFQDPPDPPPSATRTQIRKWEKHVDELVKRETSLESNLMSAYSIIYGQCSDVMRAKLESRPGFDTMESTSDS